MLLLLLSRRWCRCLSVSTAGPHHCRTQILLKFRHLLLVRPNFGGPHHHVTEWVPALQIGVLVQFTEKGVFSFLQRLSKRFRHRLHSLRGRGT